MKRRIQICKDQKELAKIEDIPLGTLTHFKEMKK